MARTLKWRDRIHEIRDRVRNSVIETWTRRDIENIFDLKRAAAQQLMKAIGEIQSVGGIHLIDRNTLLAFIEQMIHAEDPETLLRERVQMADPVPRPRQIKHTLPEGLRSIMIRDLPPEIRLERGSLEIVGKNAEEIVQRLVVLAQAIQNDMETATELLDPLPVPPTIENDELRSLFADLRAREQRYALDQQFVKRAS